MRTVQLHQLKRPTKRKPSRKVYALRWVGTDGKRYMETLGEVGKLSKRDAEAKRRAKEGEIDNRIIPRDKPKRVTLGEFMERYGDALRADVRPTTALEYEHAVKHGRAAVGDTLIMSQFTVAHVDRIKTHLRDAGKSTATVRKTLKTLNALWNRAKRYGVVQDNPFAGMATARVQSKPKRIYSGVEVGAMLDVCDDQWWRVFILLAVSTGLRKAELLHLHWSDVDFDAKAVTVSRKDAGRFTVGEQSYPVLAWSAKTHEQRTVPIPDETARALQRFRMRAGGSLYVFLTLDRLRAIDEHLTAGEWKPKADIINNLARRFTVIQRHARELLAKRRRVGVEDVPWTFGSIHDLRRTYASTMAQHVDLLTLTRWLGHADAKTTQTFYHDVLPDTADRARAALAGAWGAKQDAHRTRKRLRAVDTGAKERKIAAGATISA